MELDKPNINNGQDTSIKEPAMLLPRQSSAYRQDISHILNNVFRDHIQSDTITDETIDNLHNSSNNDGSSDLYVNKLYEIKKENELNCELFANLEKHILQSNYTSKVDNELLRKNKLLSSDDFSSVRRPTVNLPSACKTEHHQIMTKSSMMKLKAENKLSTQPQIHEITMSKSELPAINHLLQFTKKESPKKSKTVKKDVQLDQLSAIEREFQRDQLAFMQRKTAFLQAKRHIPYEKSHEKSFLKTNGSVGDLFIIRPKIIEFSNYVIGTVYEITLEVKNVSENLRPLRIIPPVSNYFSLSLGAFPGEGGLIASGVSAYYTIRFSPDSLADYTDSICIQTQNGEINVQIRARRIPPILNLPEDLYIGSCLIGGFKQFKFTIQNKGGKGRFVLMNKSQWPATNFKSVVGASVLASPFEVRPTVFELLNNGSAQLEVLFAPTQLKSYSQEFAIVCDNCQVKYFTISGNGETVKLKFTEVEFDAICPTETTDISQCPLIRFTPLNPYTYTVRQICVESLCDVDLQYNWLTYVPHPCTADQSDSAITAAAICTSSSDQSESGATDEHGETTTGRPFHQSDRVTDGLDSPFALEPLCGVIAARGSQSFIVRYAPTQTTDGDVNHQRRPESGAAPAEHHTLAQLVLPRVPLKHARPLLRRQSSDTTPSSALTSKPKPLPDPMVEDVIALQMQLKGTCVPIEVTVCPEVVHVPGQISIQTPYKHALTLKNSSPSSIFIEWQNYSKDYILEVIPLVIELEGESEHQFEMVLSSFKPMNIHHKLLCFVQYQDQPLIIDVKADVKGPEVVIDNGILDFGLIRMSDGSKSMIMYLRNVERLSANWSINLKNINESDCITFDKTSGILKPLEQIEVRVTLNTKAVKKIKGYIEVDVEDGANSVISYEANIQEPVISLDISNFKFNDIFINIPTKCCLTLINSSYLSTMFQWKKFKHANYEVNFTPNKGKIDSHSELEINVDFCAKTLGNIENCTFHCYIDEIRRSIPFELNGYVANEKLEFTTLDDLSFEMKLNVGEIESKMFILKNVTAISTKYEIGVSNFSAGDNLKKTENGLAIRVKKCEGTLKAYESRRIEVQFYSDMWGVYSDVITCMYQGKIIQIDMTVESLGCPVYYQMLATSMTRNHGNNNNNKHAGCLGNDFDEQDRRSAPLHFGCQICSGDQVTRNMRINNASPCDIRIDFEVYDDISPPPFIVPKPSDECDHQDNKDNQVSNNQHIESTSRQISQTSGRDIQEPEVDQEFISKPHLLTLRPLFGRLLPRLDPSTDDEILPNDDPSDDTDLTNWRPNIVTLLLNKSEGILREDNVFTFSPKQLCIPARSNKIVKITFNPLNTSQIFDSYINGIMSISKDCRENVKSIDKYLVRPLRLNITASTKSAFLTFESQNEDGMILENPCSNIIDDKKKKNVLMKCSMKNNSLTKLNFNVSTNYPFSIENQETSLSLKPQQCVQIGVLFDLCKDLLKFGENRKTIEKDESEIHIIENEEMNVTLINAKYGSKLKFMDHLKIKFENEDQQMFPLQSVIYLSSFEISEKNFDFGKCLIGEKRDLQFQIKNNSCSDTKWKAVLDGYSSNVKPCQTFTISPESGTLAGSISSLVTKSQLITVSFTASDTSQYEAFFKIHGEMGENVCRLGLAGVGSHNECYQNII